MNDKIYPNIDMEKTGKWLQLCMKMKGFSVKDIQEYLHLSCPQPVYRWFKGKILPSVDHLFMMSRLLGIHMEELLITKDGDSIWNDKEARNRRLILYYFFLKARMRKKERSL